MPAEPVGPTPVPLPSSPRTDPSLAAVVPAVAEATAVPRGAPTDEEGSALDTVTEDLNFVSDRLSSQVRSISIGVIALIWAVSVGDLKNGVAPPRTPLLLIGAAAVLTMGFDFLQYVAAYWSGRKALKSAIGGGDGLFDSVWWSYRLRTFFFWAKLTSAALIGLATMVVLGEAILRARPNNPASAEVKPEATRTQRASPVTGEKRAGFPAEAGGTVPQTLHAPH